MQRQAKLREIDARCLVAASELPSEEIEAKDALVRVARIVESQMMPNMSGMQGFPGMSEVPEIPGTGGMLPSQEERMQAVPLSDKEPTPGSKMDASQDPQLAPEQYKAIILLKIEIGLPSDPAEREQVKNDCVSGLFKAIEEMGGSIIGHDVKLQSPKGNS